MRLKLEAQGRQGRASSQFAAMPVPSWQANPHSSKCTLSQTAGLASSGPVCISHRPSSTHVFLSKCYVHCSPASSTPNGCNTALPHPLTYVPSSCAPDRHPPACCPAVI